VMVTFEVLGSPHQTCHATRGQSLRFVLSLAAA
jgi:hypothetical protein